MMNPAVAVELFTQLFIQGIRMAFRAVGVVELADPLIALYPR
jgi:hypothetical protein